MQLPPLCPEEVAEKYFAYPKPYELLFSFFSSALVLHLNTASLLVLDHHDNNHTSALKLRLWDRVANLMEIMETIHTNSLELDLQEGQRIAFLSLLCLFLSLFCLLVKT